MTHLLIASYVENTVSANWHLDVTLCRVFVAVCVVAIGYIFSIELANPAVSLAALPSPRRTFRARVRWIRSSMRDGRLGTPRKRCAVSTSHQSEPQTSDTSHGKSVSAHETRSSANRHRIAA